MQTLLRPAARAVWAASLLGAAFLARADGPLTAADVWSAEKLIGLEFSDAKIEMLLPGLREQARTFEALRAFPLSNGIPPALVFHPLPAGARLETKYRRLRLSPAPQVGRPANLEDLAFRSVRELGELIRHRRVSSEDLVQMCLARLKRHGPRLQCVVTLLEERALREAREADREIQSGHYRGPLHGIPYGAKDLLAAAGAPTTWGVAPYASRVLTEDAAVIRKLRAAGAVLVAKTTLGELAMGDVWFGGRTRNPWNLQQGSSGSSAGSAAVTAAGLLPFAIGTETYGSIVSPADRCGVTGLRPTYGRVSRSGAMTLSWSMDKIGPLCRTVEDCALVLDAIRGSDGLDDSVLDAPFNYDARLTPRKLRIGFLAADFERQTGARRTNDDRAIAVLRSLGARLLPMSLPEFPLSSISFLLSTEAAAAFDGLTRSGLEDQLKQQGAGDWPNTFRQRRFVPAVEYLQAQRVRYLLVQETARVFDQVDVLVAPSTSGRSLLHCNLTGHPCVVVPNGFHPDGTPTSICFIGNLYDEARMLALAHAYQAATPYHLQHPPLDSPRP